MVSRATLRNCCLRASLGVSMLGSASAQFYFAQQAFACDCGCFGGNFVPERGLVPASLGAIAWSRRLESKGASWQEELSFESIDPGGKRSPVAFRVERAGLGGHRVIPIDGLEPGIRYELKGHSGSTTCNGEENAYHRAEFFTSYPTSFPTVSSLGEIDIDVSPSRGTLSLAAAECSKEVEVQFMDVRVDLHPQMKAWKDALVYETIVDGERWQPKSSACDSEGLGASWKGRGKERVFVICDQEARESTDHPGLRPGAHTLQFRARVEGHQSVFVSTILNFDLRCNATSPEDTKSASSITQAHKGRKSEAESQSAPSAVGGSFSIADGNNRGSVPNPNHEARELSGCAIYSRFSWEACCLAFLSLFGISSALRGLSRRG